MSNLEDKIREVETEDAIATVNNNLKNHQVSRQMQAAMIMGGIRAVDRVAKGISSQAMVATIRFQDDKLHEEFGFDRFADFLDKSPYSPMTKHEFYKRKEVFDSEGEQTFDALNAINISLTTRKALVAGGVEMFVDGDELVIADQRVPVTDRHAVKQLVDAFHDVLTERDAREAQKDKKIEEQKFQLDRGQEDYNELERNLVAMRQGDPHDRGVADAVFALLEVTRLTGQMPDAKKAERGPYAIKALWDAMLQVRKAYNVPFSFEDTSPARTSDLDDIAAQVLAADDDLDS